MRAVLLLLVVVALAAAVCEGSQPANTITGEAHTCCATALCSAEQKASLRSRVSTYDGPDAESTRTYVELALSGAACGGNGRSKRALGDYLNIKCAPGPFDVQYGTVSVTCTVDMKIAAGINNNNMYAYIYANGLYYKSIYPDNYYYYDQNATQTTFSRTYTIVLPQYAPDGNYTATAYGSSIGYSSYVSNTTKFLVLKTKNDVTPPVVTAFGPSVININDDNKIFTFSATDDFSGVSYFSVSIQNSTGTVAYGYWYPPYTGTGYTNGLTSVSSTGSLYLYNGVVAGTYSVYITVQDVIGYNNYYTAAQLASLGISSTIIFASSGCAAGSYRAYNTTGACTTCPVGTYAAQGAFKCSTCPPGTSSGVTGAASCTPCPPGQSGIGASWACSYCTPGTYNYNAGNYFCRSCSPGQNTTATGATSCGYCPPGTFSTGGATTCTQCAPGTYSGGFGSSCTRCSPGTYTSLSGSAYCNPCPSGTYSGLGQSSCTACPAPRVMSSAGSNSQLNCY